MIEFKLNKIEEERAREFKKIHLECERKHPTAIGGNITYHFTDTSIGTAVSISCHCCGEEENITDYNSW